MVFTQHSGVYQKFPEESKTIIERARKDKKLESAG
jgi:hypothetical protein